MTTTGRLQDILAQIRSTLSSKSGRATNRPGAASGPARDTATPHPTIEQLQAQISTGLAPLDMATPQGRRQARRVFLESVLLGEFGLGLANDPRFAEIVAGVQDSFEQQPELLSDLDTVLEDLRGR